jgi:biuret amidohydrolase
MADSKRPRNTSDPSKIFTIDFKVNPASTALLIIDMQKNGYCEDFGLGKIWLESMPEKARYWFSRLHDTVTPNIRSLLTFFRDNGLRVIFIRVGPFLADGSDMIERRRLREETSRRRLGLDHIYYLGSPELQIIDELKPQSGELVIDKNSASAFNSTNIDQILRNLGIESLVITGVATNACVETTARDAADRGYKCILVDDACATIQGQEVHDMTMHNFASLFGKVMSASETLKTLTS